MKKGFLKTLAALAAGAMLLSMNMSAFALEYTASTAYTDATTATVTVNYKAEADSQVAFLAENGSEIIYVDQRPGSDAFQTFSFKVDLAEVTTGTPTIKVGSNWTAASGSQSIELAAGNKNVTITAGANGYVALDDGSLTDTVAASTVSVYALPASGYEVDAITVDGTPITAIEQTNGAYSIALPYVAEGSSADVAINFTFKAKTFTSAPTANVSMILPSTEAGKRSIMVMGSATNASELGILLSKADVDTLSALPEVYSATADVRAFPVLAQAENGQFIITLEDSGEFVHLNGTVYVDVYATQSGNVVIAEDLATGNSVTFQ